jgi:hypothetical protein
MEDIVEMPNLFFSPNNMIIAGPSYSGKSALIKLIIENNRDLYTEELKGVLYCHGEDDIQFLESLNNDLVTTHRGVPTMETLDEFIAKYDGGHVLCIFDDLSIEIMSDENNYRLFCQKSHHNHCSFILVQHSVFSKSKIARLIAMNTHYLILTRNLRDQSTISHLARQLFPSKSKSLVQCYQFAMENKLRPDDMIPPCLLLSFHPFHSTKDNMIYSDFLPPQLPRVLYRI